MRRKITYADRVGLHKTEMERRSRLQKTYPSPATRKRYRVARKACGCKERKTILLWGLLHFKTTFKWRMPTVELNALALLEEFNRQCVQRLDKPLPLNMIRAIYLTWGIAEADILNTHFKDRPFAYARSIAAAILKRRGVNRITIARAFKCNHKSAKHMTRRGDDMLREWDNGPLAVNWRLALIGQSTGLVPISIFAGGEADLSKDEAGCIDHSWRSDRGEGSSFG